MRIQCKACYLGLLINILILIQMFNNINAIYNNMQFTDV